MMYTISEHFARLAGVSEVETMNYADVEIVFCIGGVPGKQGGDIRAVGAECSTACSGRLIGGRRGQKECAELSNRNSMSVAWTDLKHTLSVGEVLHM
jgi:hypothetical protein